MGRGAFFRNEKRRKQYAFVSFAFVCNAMGVAGFVYFGGITRLKDFGKKFFQTIVFRRGKNLFRITLFANCTAVHKQHF